ncbi:MAG TPA: hypothetical protein DIS78_07840 [Lachnospiraceae bacterium]|nr:hypothetical protein [Lachnospiraceae bacterium]
MNIELQLCGLVMLVVFLVFIEREKKLNVKNRALFLAAFITCIICLIFDVVSIICIHEAVYNGFSPLITRIVCKAYIILLVTQGYCSFLYSCLDIAIRHSFRLVRMLTLGVYIAGEVLIVVLPIDYHMDGRLVYSYGPAAMCAYIMAAFFISVILVFTVKNKRNMPHRRVIALFTWQGLWLIAAMIQFFFKDVLLVSFASAFGMIVLYSQLENPNEHIDRMTGLFTQNALSLYLNDRYKYSDPFAFYTARIKYLVPSTELDIRKNAVMRSAAGFLELGKEPIFRIGDDMFCIIYDSSERAYQKLLEIKARADGVTDIPVEAKFIYFPDSSLLSGPDEVYNFIHHYDDSSEDVIVCTGDLVQQMRYRSEVYNLIENALRDDRVVVHYQPIYNISTGSFTSAEALVRIVKEDGTLIPPGDFIPVAEDNGQIIQLGIRVFEKVCKLLASGEPQRLGIEYIETNISVAQFDHENPAGFVQNNIEAYKINPCNINLEITETADNELQHLLLLNMEKLIKMGVSFSLDDFGTGRSNLDYFVNMPADNIKFDLTFTQGYFKNDKIKHVMKGMVSIVHDMDMKIVAEGVETKAQYDAMVKLGVDYIQGYYFSKPIPAEEFIAFLKDSNL